MPETEICSHVFYEEVIGLTEFNFYVYSCGLLPATMEYSCLPFCVCLSVCIHDNYKIMTQST